MAKKPNKAMHHRSLNRSSKSILKKTLHAVTEQRQDQREMRKELMGMAQKALTEEFGTFIETFHAMLIEHRIMKDFVLETSGMTIEEWNKKYNEFKEKQKAKLRKEDQARPRIKDTKAPK